MVAPNDPAIQLLYSVYPSKRDEFYLIFWYLDITEIVKVQDVQTIDSRMPVIYEPLLNTHLYPYRGLALFHPQSPPPPPPPPPPPKHTPIPVCNVRMYMCHYLNEICFFFHDTYEMRH